MLLVYWHLMDSTKYRMQNYMHLEQHCQSIWNKRKPMKFQWNHWNQYFQMIYVIVKYCLEEFIIGGKFYYSAWQSCECNEICVWSFSVQQKQLLIIWKKIHNFVNQSISLKKVHSTNNKQIQNPRCKRLTYHYINMLSTNHQNNNSITLYNILIPNEQQHLINKRNYNLLSIFFFLNIFKLIHIVALNYIINKFFL